MIKIYGSHRSSGGRCYITLEECGLKYETVNIDMRAGQHKSPEYMKLNPNGKVPTMVDGDFVLWESMAIDRYLVEKYKPELLGPTIEDRALIEQWTIWAIAELQPPLIDLLIQMAFVPEPKRDLALIEKSRAKLPGKLEVLDGALRNREYMVANYFSLADINVASVANIGMSLGIDYSNYASLTNWLSKMKARPSFKKFEEKTGH